jgi:hypothetical protein
MAESITLQQIRIPSPTSCETAITRTLYPPCALRICTDTCTPLPTFSGFSSVIRRDRGSPLPSSRDVVHPTPVSLGSIIIFPTCSPATTFYTYYPCPTTCYTPACQPTITASSSPSPTSNGTTSTPTVTSFPCPAPTFWLPVLCLTMPCPNPSQRRCVLTRPEAKAKIEALGNVLKKVGGADDDCDDCATITKTGVTILPSTCKFSPLPTVTSLMPCPSACVNTCTVVETVTACE